jgi:endonuclease-3
MTVFYKEYPDAQSIANLPIEYIEQRISSIGLYKTKAKNMLASAKIIVEKFNGKVPESYDELIQLPGVGRKTANVVRSIAFNQAAIAVDTHVFRVSNRLGIVRAGDVLQTELQLQKVIPKSKWSEAHHWLIWHGRRICRAQKPLCDQCKLSEDCSYFLQYKDEILYWKGK